MLGAIKASGTYSRTTQDEVNTLLDVAHHAKVKVIRNQCVTWTYAVWQDTQHLKTIKIEEVFWEYPIGIPFTNHWLGHGAIKVTLPDGSWFYLDNGWWGNGDHIFGETDVSGTVTPYKPPVEATLHLNNSGNVVVPRVKDIIQK